MRPARLALKLAMLAGFGVALSACASGMSKNECLTADWRAIGYEDGLRGLDASAVSGRRQACANKANVTADMDAYLAGREAGLSEFCRPANGFEYGSRGQRYAGVCAGKNEAPFVVAYQRGLKLYGFTTDLSDAEGRLAAAENELADIERAISAHEIAIVSPTTPNLERGDHLAALKSLHERRANVRADLPGLARDRDRASDALEYYRRELASYERGATKARADYY